MRVLRSLHFGHWVMALLLLFAVVAPTLSRMTCLEGGHSQLVLGDLSDCCPELPAPDGPAFKGQCCIASTAQAEAAQFVPAQGTGVPHHDVLVAVLPVGVAPVLELNALPSYESGPPPLDAPARLARLQVLRV